MTKSKTQCGSKDVAITVAKNVVNRNGVLRIQFKLPDSSSYIWRSTGLPATKSNIDVAIGKLANIKTDINSGIYELNKPLFWKKHFPLSKESQQQDPQLS